MRMRLAAPPACMAEDCRDNATCILHLAKLLLAVRISTPAHWTESMVGASRFTAYSDWKRSDSQKERESASSKGKNMRTRKSLIGLISV